MSGGVIKGFRCQVSGFRCQIPGVPPEADQVSGKINIEAKAVEDPV